MALLKNLITSDIPAELAELSVSDVNSDSRSVKPGCLFFAIRGTKADGTQFAAAAVKQGAVALVVEPESVAACKDLGVPLIRSEDVRRDYSFACARIFQNPSSKIHCIGVTGTNGKTSVSWILAHALSYLGRRSSLCGTLGKKVPVLDSGDFEVLANTSPDPKIVHSFLHDALEADCESAVLEVTSQGVLHHRTSSVNWDIGVFTNLSRDHLDVHGDMESYAQAKLRFFTQELGASNKPNKLAILNIDDEVGMRFFEVLSKEFPQIKCLSFSTSKDASGIGRQLQSTMDKTVFEATLLGDKVQIESKLVGAFNVSNLLAAATVLAGMGFSGEEIRRAMKDIPPVPGRLEVISAGEFHAVVDYAHTPDGLIQAQRSLRPLTRGRLITVFGCGGDRDRGKRPIMGEAVAELADVGVVTSDNPRTEDPERIIADILPGIENTRAKRPSFSSVQRTDRKAAIAWALQEAKAGDVVLVAGKGHEDYQEIGLERFPFSDQSICRSIIDERAGRA